MELLIPDHVKALSPAVDNSDFGDPTGFPSISMSQGQRDFKIKVGDEESRIPAPLHVVILGISPKGSAKSRSYYAAGYNEGDASPPDCSSKDGVQPDQGDSRQSEKCAVCPLSAFGSDPTGRGGQACKEHKSLLVVLTEKPDAQSVSHAISKELFIHRVSVMGLKGLASYGRELGNYGVHRALGVTEFSYELGKDYPQLKLKLVGFLDATIGPEAVHRAESPEVLQLVATPPSQMLEAPAPRTEVRPPPPSPDVSGAPPQEEKAPPAAQPPAAQGPGVDTAGIPWDERIHASTQTKVKDGQWKKKKGVDPATFHAVMAELVQKAGPKESESPAPPAPPETEGSSALADTLSKWM